MRTESITVTAHRRAAVAVLVLLGALALTGCQTTKTTCSDGACTITFTGGKGGTNVDGSSLGSGRKTVYVGWASTRDGTATISVGGEQGTCTAGRTETLGGFAVTCLGVGDDELRVKVEAG